MPDYDDAQRVRDARARYFRENDFGDDGGYAKDWVTFKIGPLPFAIPNTAGRVRAVRLHDLHHVATGYATSFVGEAEIGAWEIAASCGRFVAAWVLNLYAFAIGVAIAPGPLWRAFLRGRRTRTLYTLPWDETLLDAKVGELRARLGLDRAATPAGVADVLAFAGWSLAAVAFSWLTIALVLGPLLLAARALLRHIGL